MKKFISLMLTVSLLCTFFVFGVNAEDGEELTRLTFGADGKFTVLQLTDPQEDACIADGLIEFIEKSIEATDPDFIVITGDLVENSRAGDISDSEIFKEGVTVDGDYEKTLENTKRQLRRCLLRLKNRAFPMP
ncbi:MAG: metallophosphoesterase [Clostridia bacterium]|nr:metallophosphoesterase [Clostridia bacterium]